jgi:hypothetical protein
MKPVSLILAAAITAYVIVRRKKFSREGLVFMTIVVIGLIVHGTGAVKLPHFEELIVDIAESLGAWTYLRRTCSSVRWLSRRPARSSGSSRPAR